MPSIGPLEILVVSVIALIVFGPHRLPEIARTVGKTLAELKRMATDVRADFEEGMKVEDAEDEPVEDEPVEDESVEDEPVEDEVAGDEVVEDETEEIIPAPPASRATDG